jgi:hypothetical protein
MNGPHAIRIDLLPGRLAVREITRDHREVTMRSMLTAAAIAMLVVLIGSQPVSAEITYPWCAQYGGGDRGGRNCGFSNYEQCRAAISGNGGYCIENPMYRPPAQPPGPRRARRSVG